MSVRLYVGNLPKEEVDRQELQSVFAEFGDSVTTKVIKDRKSGKCRGFAFVTVKTDEQADEFIEKFNGYNFKDSPLKIEKALPRSKGEKEDEAPRTAAPTPSGGSPSGGGSSNANRRGGANKKSKRSGASTSSTNHDSDTFQPDPRWADELAKLKEMLAAQTSN